MKTNKPKKLTSTIEWVSVEERLPENGQSVIVLNSKSGSMKFSEQHDGQWFNIGGGPALHCDFVTHWAEMPVFPEEK